MDDKIYLKIDNDVLPVEPNKGYSLSLSDYDNVNKTEAGTSIREVTRVDIPSISVSFDCDAEMLRGMRKYKSKPSVLVEYYDPSKSGDLSEDEMYVKGYSEQMLADTDDGGIWRVKFNLEDLGNV